MVRIRCERVLILRVCYLYVFIVILCVCYLYVFIGRLVGSKIDADAGSKIDADASKIDADSR